MCVCSSFLLLLPTSVVHLAFHLALANKLRTPKPFVSLQNARQPYMSPSVAFAAATLASSFSVSSWPRLWQTTFSPSLNWPRNDQAGTSTKECGWMVVSGERVWRAGVRACVRCVCVCVCGGGTMRTFAGR